jgi:hypothetical protein
MNAPVNQKFPLAEAFSVSKVKANRFDSLEEESQGRSNPSSVETSRLN